MLRSGPVPAFIHGLVEYAAALLFIAAPFVFGFESDAATAVSIVVGIGILVVTASTAMQTGLAKVIPIGIHVVLDFVTAAILVAAPFLFGFSDESTPTVFFIVLGIVHLLLTISTRFAPGESRSTSL